MFIASPALEGGASGFGAATYYSGYPLWGSLSGLSITVNSWMINFLHIAEEERKNEILEQAYNQI